MSQLTSKVEAGVVKERIDGRRARRAGTRDAILKAALALFAARGVSSTSVDDIAEKAGIAKGSIYYNFTNKDGVVSELMTHHATRLGEALASAARSSGPEGRREILRTLLNEVHDHPDVAQLMVSEIFRTDRSWLDVVRQWRSIMTDPLENNLVAEFGEQCRAQCSMQATALVGAALSVGMDWLMRCPELDVEVVLDQLAGMPQIS